MFFRKLDMKEHKLMNRCAINILEDSYLLMINIKRHVNMNIFRTKSYYYSFYYSFYMQKITMKNVIKRNAYLHAETSRINTS